MGVKQRSGFALRPTMSLPKNLTSALITTRGIAHTVLNIATDRPMPRQGLGQRRVVLIVDLVILLLTGALILSLVRISGWYGQLAMHGIASPSDLTWRVGLMAILHFIWPLALLYVALKVPYWIIIFLYQPDLILCSSQWLRWYSSREDSKSRWLGRCSRRVSSTATTGKTSRRFAVRLLNYLK